MSEATPSSAKPGHDTESHDTARHGTGQAAPSCRQNWDFGGAWITDCCQILHCDHAHGVHHSTLALDLYEAFILPGEGGVHDRFSNEIAVDLAYQAGWIRIMTQGQRYLAIDWRGMPERRQLQTLIGHLNADPTPYDRYEAEDEAYVLHSFDSAKQMIAYLRRRMIELDQDLV